MLLNVRDNPDRARISAVNIKRREIEVRREIDVSRTEH